MSLDTPLEGGSTRKHKRKHKQLLIVADDALALEAGTNISRRKLFEPQLAAPAGSSQDAASGAVQPEHVADTYHPAEDGDTMDIDMDIEDGDTAVENIVQIVDPRRTAAKRIYTQDRRLLNEQRERYWNGHLPALVECYLELKRRRQAGETLDIVSTGPGFQLSVAELLDPCTSRLFTRKNEDEHAVIVLLRYGYMACTPAQPALAIGLHALEFYHQLRRQQPRLGIQAYARALCRMSNVPYSPDFRAQFSDAFDAYLMLLRAVDRALDSFLGRDSPGWRVKNSCPACTFKVEGEPDLPAGRLWAMDGNGSLKRHANAGSAQSRKFHSDYMLTASQVDVYKDEVRPQTAPATKTDLVQGAEPGDGAEEPIPCVSHWKNLQPEHMKRALTQFEQTGAFVSACRHGFIMWWAEMIRSGELAKYGLAHVAAMLEHAIDKSQRAGYDIGCGFETTLRNSILGGLVKDADLRTLVGVFHGHAHNRLCQLRWHPLIFEGIGLEDFETCERVFFGSNEVARIVRYASEFHYQQAIDLHWRQHDSARYEELSRWLVRRFWHAYRVRESSNSATEDAQKTFGFGPEDYKTWLREEREYLAGLRKEPEQDVLAISYVQAIMAADEARKKYEATHRDFASLTADHYALGPNAVRTLTSTFTRAETARRTAEAKHMMALEAVRAYEEKLGPEKRWEPGCAEWNRTVRYAHERTYRLALDHLERLVVQRLLELTKANMSGVCYKQRVQIARALKNRSAAIRTALDRYNDAARALEPTTVPLEWEQVVSWTELQDFTLLRFARRDVRERPWAQGANRLLMNQYHKSVRAQEELDRVRVEVRRLRAYTDHNDRELADALTRAEHEQLPIAAELRHVQHYRKHVNAAHRARLDALIAYEAFSGPPEPLAAGGSQDPSAAPHAISTTSGVRSSLPPPLPDDLDDEPDEEEMVTQEDEIERILQDAERDPVVDDLAPMFFTWSLA